MAREENSSQESGIDRIEPQNRQDTFRKSNFTQSEVSRERGQKVHFYRSEEQRESKSLQERQQSNGTASHKIKADFKSPLKIHLINQMMEWNFYKKAVIYLKIYQAKSR